jgi:hypothetical protein
VGWFTITDAYCERTDASYWSEPVNALTNAAFLIAAFVMWRRCRGADVPLAGGMIALLATIGVGSFLFHTHAVVWAAVLDVAPIALFILIYVFAANLHFWNLSWIYAIGATALYFPYSYLATVAINQQPLFAISGQYWPVPLLIGLYAFALRNRAKQTSRGLAIGAGILVVSLIARSTDELLCDSIPLGTHFLWHILNAVMLGWMIEVYRRHRLAERA